MQVLGKGTTLMDDLEVNDKVFVGSEDSNKSIYQGIYGFGHYNKNNLTEYLQIHTSPSSNEPLEISAAHLLYVEGKDHPVRADTIQRGDVLIQKGPHSSTTSVQVTKILEVRHKGAYMPLTRGRSIVVNGILTSSYVSIMDDAPEVVTKYLKVVSEDQLLHWWLSPYRMVCQRVPSLCKNDKDSEGVAYWLVFGRYLARLANGWGVVSQILGLALVGFLLALAMGLEAMLAVFGTIPGGLFVLIVAGLTKKTLKWRRERIEKKIA